MRSLSRVALLATFIIVLLQSSFAAATLLDFEGFSDPFGSSIPAGYGGLNWTNVNYLNSASVIAVPNSGFPNGTVSPTYVAYNANGTPASVTIPSGTFDFNSAYLTAGWNTGLNVLVKGFLLGSELYSQNIVVNTTGPTFVNFNYLGVDTLTFESSGGTRAPNTGNGPGGTQFVMDNLTINAPEPSTLALLTLGGVIAFTAKRRRG